MSGAPGVRRDRPGLLLRFAVLLGAPPAVLTAEPRAQSGPFWGPILGRAGMLFAPVAVAATVGFGLEGFVLAKRSAAEPAGEFAVAWALTLVATAAACLVIGVVHPLGPRPWPPDGGGGDGGPDRDRRPPARPPGHRAHGFRPVVRTRRRSRPRSRA